MNSSDQAFAPNESDSRAPPPVAHIASGDCNEWSPKPAVAALGIVFLINIIGYIDRAAINILQIPIKAELGLSDSQIGLLIGLAFYLPYIMLTAPIARLADRRNRKHVLAAGLAVWSAMTATMGLASGMIALIACRIGVAAGESAAAPSSISIISDHFPPARRGAAIGIFSLHVPLGSTLGIALGGLLAVHLGWRNVFVVLGCLGLAVLPLLLFGLKEPKRAALSRADGVTIGFVGALRQLWTNRTFRYLNVAIACHLFVIITIQTWSAPFYARSHGLPLHDVAIYLGLATGIGGAVGSIGSGLLADRLSRLNERWYAWLPGITTFLLLPVTAVQLLVGSLTVSMIAATVTAILAAAYLAPAMVITQAIVPRGMRAFSVSIVIIVGNAFGAILGPLSSGMLSDFLESRGEGADSLRNAMLASLGLALFGFLSFFAAARHLPQDIEAARAP